MIEPTEGTESFDEVLGRFLAELERGANREHLIRTYSLQHPDRAREFREYADLPALLDQAAERADEQHPARLGDFRIVREISHGGMKTVYEAIQEPLERRVAVATIRRGHILPAHRERFLREQRVLARLHQTHIVPIFAAGEAGPIQYFAMPYIEGAALHHVIQIASSTATRGADSQTPSLKKLVHHVLQPLSDNSTTCAASGGPAPQRAGPAPGGTTRESTAPAPAVPLPTPRLSRDYYRSVAKVMADVAESLQHAHEHGFLHRDLKPANIMVDQDERCWLIDFGLAGLLQTPDPSTDHAELPGADDSLTSTRGVLGTPGYMAPEQEAGESTDARTDVWGLGATLYELLTLRRAFPDQLRGKNSAAASHRPPPAPRSVIGSIPRDLEAICLKSLRVEPGSRYQTAGEVAEDLHRWLRGEPTLAHPARAPRRTYLWAKRNKGWASAIAVSLLAFLALTTAAALVQRARAESEAAAADQQRARADMADAQAKEQRARADMAAAQAKEQRARAEKEAERANQQRRASLMVQVQNLLGSARTDGWSRRAWELESEVVQFRSDAQVRNQAAAILAGLDAAVSKKLPESAAQSIRFDPQGRRLLMGTLVPNRQAPASAKLWDSESDRFEELRGAGIGPVAFGQDGAPLQLTLDHAQNQLALIDLSTARDVSRLATPPAEELRFSAPLAVTADGTSLAAAAVKPGGDPAGVLLWNAAPRDWLPVLPFGDVSGLAFSPDGTLLAAGDADGNIAVWSVRTGRELVSLQASRNAVLCLAFSRDRRRAANPADAEADGWLLAAGDEGSTVTIWDLTRRIPRSYCRGNGYDVRAVAFSPDGVTLACSGHSEVRMWDAASGQLLLFPRAFCGNARGLAFSPDGRRLAVGGEAGAPVAVFELTAGRGVTHLRGLACPISKTCFSRDGRYLAALAHNWELGLWDLHSGFLLHVWEVPRGLFADNAALAFSPDGQQLAFSAGREAVAWDVASGRQLRRWELYEGFVDQLAYAGPDRLLSLRVETQDGRLGPYSNAHPAQHPRVCRLRELPEQGPPRVIKGITDFNLHVFCAAAAPAGEYFVIEGLSGTPGQVRRLLKAYDAAGRELATLPTLRPAASQSGLQFCDPTGNLLAVYNNLESIEEITLFEMPACREAGKLAANPLGLSPGGAYHAVSGSGLLLFRRRDATPVVVFDEGQSLPVVRLQFDAAGDQLAWGRQDGTVVVADLPEVQRRLAELGLGWQLEQEGTETTEKK